MNKLAAVIFFFWSTLGLSAAEKPETLFNLAKQAIVLGQERFTADGEVYDESRLQPVAYLPDFIIPMSTDVTRFANTEAYYQYNQLNPYSIRSPAIKDNVAIHSHFVKARANNRPVIPGILFLSVRMQGYYNVVASKLIADLESSDDANVLEDPINYGKDWQGSGGAGINIMNIVAYRADFYFQNTKIRDPDRAFVNGKGNIDFKDPQTTKQLNVVLHDRVDLHAIGASGEVVHGEEIWNLEESEMTYAQERFLIDPISTYINFAHRSFRGLTSRLWEPSIGFIFSRGGKGWQGLKNNADMPVALELGARIEQDSNEVYAYRFMVYAGVLKAEYTYQLKDKNGEDRELNGLAWGLGMKIPPGLSFELVYYFNYLYHVDNVPLLERTNFWKFSVGGSF